MKQEDLERYLERGDLLGFVKQTDDDDFLGWILLNKLKPNERFLAVLEPDENPELVSEQEHIRRKPYHVAVVELSREAYEDDRYETNEDYRLNEHHNFSELNEVQAFVRKLGHDLQNIKWATEIGAP